eukprot:COSAG05_NODE_354_length_10862_cov_59.954659_9_plen_102_part_00
MTTIIVRPTFMPVDYRPKSTALFAYDIAHVVTNISTQDYDMVARANRKAVSGRRSKAERRGGRQGSGRSAEQLASKIRARRSAGSWTKTIKILIGIGTRSV